MKTLEDIVAFNDTNRGSEGGVAGDLPMFPDGQRLLRKCVETKGIKDETYHAALKHIQRQCREMGIDAALRVPTTEKKRKYDGQGQETILLDALLFCDVKASGIQIAAQAGYPVLTIPVGLDPDGLLVSLTLQHSAWQDDKLIKWASAIEDLTRHHQGITGDEEEEEEQDGGGESFAKNNDADTSLPEPQNPETQIEIGKKKENDKKAPLLGRIPPTCKNHLSQEYPHGHGLHVARQAKRLIQRATLGE